MLYQQRSAPPPGDKPDEFVMSDGSIDRMGDVIEPAGWLLDRLMSDPVALFNHNPNQIVGKWVDIAVRKGRLIGRLVWDESGVSPVVEHLRALVRQGILRTVSVGFRPIEKEKLGDKADEWFGPFRFTKSELLECSLVAVPANPNALSTAKSLHIPRELFAEIFCKPATGDPDRSTAAHGKPAAQSLARQGATMTPRTERIKAAQTTLNEMRDRLAELDDLETRSTAEDAEYVELSPKIEAAAKNLEAMEAAERALAGKTVQRLPERRSTVPARPRNTENEREYLFKTMTALFVSKGTNRVLDDVLRERYGDDAINTVIRAAVSPATTTTAGWAAELVGTAIADFLNSLPRSAIFPTLSRVGSKFTFGRDGIIKMPARTATPKVNGSFVGEGQPIPVRKAGVTSISLTPKKMAVISTFTREMANHSTPSIESVIRQAMNEDTAEAIDTALIDNVAADAIRPAGLLNGLTTLTPAATGTQFEKMVADINTLVGPIATARGGQSLVMLLNQAQKMKMSWAVAPNGTFVFTSVENGQVRDLTVVSSPTVPAARVIMLDGAEFASATGDSPEFDVSDVATLHEEDTAPLPIVTGAQGSGVVASPTRSLWQTASLGVRMILPMNWAMRRTGMVTFMDGVTW